MNYMVKVKCPYYETRASDSKKQPTITCQNVENNLGFDIRNQIVFRCHQEKNDYAEIFCEDLYESCPYYKAIYKEEETNEKKKKLNQKSKGCGTERKGCKKTYDGYAAAHDSH